jgi:hypothetical protein
MVIPQMQDDSWVTHVGQRSEGPPIVTNFWVVENGESDVHNMIREGLQIPTHCRIRVNIICRWLEPESLAALSFLRPRPTRPRDQCDHGTCQVPKPGTNTLAAQNREKREV